MTSRERFEAEVTYKRDLDRLPGGAYAWPQAQREWEVWQASRAAALEEAKAVVSSSCLGDIPGCNRTCCPGCHTIAAERIGALAGRGA